VSDKEAWLGPRDLHLGAPIGGGRVVQIIISPGGVATRPVPSGYIEPDRVREAPAVGGLTIREVGADEADAWESIIVAGFGVFRM
jgi:hypothetical protein